MLRTMRSRMTTAIAVLAAVTATAIAMPASAAATTYQYGCCSTSNGTVLKTTDGWLVRTSNNKNTPSGKWYELAGFAYNGTFSGALYYDVSTLSQTYSYPAGSSSARHECINNSGFFLVNVSCWTIQ